MVVRLAHDNQMLQAVGMGDRDGGETKYWTPCTRHANIPPKSYSQKNLKSHPLRRVKTQMTGSSLAESVHIETASNSDSDS